MRVCCVYIMLGVRVLCGACLVVCACLVPSDLSVCVRARVRVLSFFCGWFCVKAAKVRTRPRSESTPRAATKVSKVGTWRPPLGAS